MCIFFVVAGDGPSNVILLKPQSTGPNTANTTDTDDDVIATGCTAMIGGKMQNVSFQKRGQDLMTKKHRKVTWIFVFACM